MADEPFKNQLSLTAEDVVLEIGADTGKDSAYLRDLLGARLPWVAMDPSQKMCDVASKYPGLVVQKASRQESVEALQRINPQNSLNKNLMKYCAHHFYDALPKVAKDLFNYLPSGGSVLIVAQDKRCGLHLKKKAFQSILATVIDPKGFADVFEEEGFKVSVEIVYYETKVTRQFWNHFLKNRVYSTLRDSTDEEI